MALPGNLPTLIGICTYLLYLALSVEGIYNPLFLKSLEHFNQDLFRNLIEANGRESIIYSPFNIQASLTMVRMGASGKTAHEMDLVLHTLGQSLTRVAESFHSMLAKYKGSKLLPMANKIYAKENCTVLKSYKNLLSQKYLASAENLNFRDKVNASNTINKWLTLKTHKGITNLLSPNLLKNDIGLLLFSAVHFKSKWSTPFPIAYTSEQNFYIDDFRTKRVQMMFRKGAFDYGLIRDLLTYVVRLPFKDTNLSMLIMLPVQRAGLEELLPKFRNFTFQSLRNGVLISRSGLVHMPKFKVEFEVELSDVLRKMGMQRMFQNAEFDYILESLNHCSFSKIIHKASIEINEGDPVEIEHRAEIGSSPLSPFILKMDHPFVYAIINEDFIPLLQGAYVGI